MGRCITGPPPTHRPRRRSRPRSRALTQASAAVDAGLTATAEGFADRVYEPDGRLRSRALAGSLHEDPEAAAAQALGIARDGTVVAADGSTLAVRADTLCIHGDTPGAAAIATAVRRALTAGGFDIRPPHA